MGAIILDACERESVQACRIARDLGITPAHALGICCSLWAWALVHASTGRLGDLQPDELAGACGWGGNPDALLAALVNHSVVAMPNNPDDPGGMAIVGWSALAVDL